MATRNIDKLTPREREILVLIAEGRSIVEIAHQLHRSQKTIESHRLSIGKKLEASNRVELAKIAIAAGLVSVGPGVASASGQAQRDLAQQELDRLSTISQAVNSATGLAFIDQLCVTLTQVLGVRLAAVCVPHSDEQGAERLVMSYSENGVMKEPFSYSPDSKPVQSVIDNESCVICHGLTEVYPDAPFLSEYKSYVGIRLDQRGEADSGVLAVAHDKQLDSSDEILRILRFFPLGPLPS